MKARLRLIFFVFILLISTIACQTLIGTTNNENQTISTPTSDIATNIIDDTNDNENNTNDSEAISPTPIIETFNLTKEGQIEILGDLWEVVDEEYLYQDFNGLDWTAEKEVVLLKIDKGFKIAVSKMVLNQIRSPLVLGNRMKTAVH